LFEINYEFDLSTDFLKQTCLRNYTFWRNSGVSRYAK